MHKVICAQGVDAQVGQILLRELPHKASSNQIDDDQKQTKVSHYTSQKIQDRLQDEPSSEARNKNTLPLRIENRVSA